MSLLTHHHMESPGWQLEPAIKIVGASKSYTGTMALRSVSLELPRGELGIVTGSSGSGKSTLMRIVEGIEEADSGRIGVLGHDFSQLSENKRRKIIRNQVGIAFQDPLLDRSLTVLDNVVLFAGAQGKKLNEERLASLAETFGLGDVLNKEASKLSGGQQIRVSVLRAMALDKQLVLADEPTNHLDTENKVAMFDSISAAVHNLGATALVVTHDTVLAREIADREFSMHDGSLVDIRTYVH